MIDSSIFRPRGYVSERENGGRRLEDQQVAAPPVERAATEPLTLGAKASTSLNNGQDQQAAAPRRRARSH